MRGEENGNSRGDFSRVPSPLFVRNRDGLPLAFAPAHTPEDQALLPALKETLKRLREEA